jgi:uncharacterized protein (DUF983 family)
MPIRHRTSTFSAIGRGLKRRCPACDRSPAFAGYLRTVDECKACGAPLGQIRADDFPPYLTILIVGHIVVPLLLLIEQNYAWPVHWHMIVWPALTLVLSLVMLPWLKGGVLGLMWSLGMTGRDVQGGGAS